MSEFSGRLRARQYRALSEICDAFCPSGDGLPSATELGVPDAVVEAVARNPRRSERQQLAALLSLWDTPALGAVAGAGFKRFGSLPREQRERVLLRWGDSGLPQQRAVFQALRKAALLFYYMLRSPAWDAIGYPGPLGPRIDAPPRALDHDAGQRRHRARLRRGDRRLRRRRRRGGRDPGRRRPRRDRGRDGRLLRRRRLHGLGARRADALLHGRADRHPRPERGAARRLSAWAAGPSSTTRPRSAPRTRCAPSGRRSACRRSSPTTTPPRLDAVWERLGVNQEHNQPSTREQKLQEGCVGLGWHVDAMPRGVRACAQGVECGYCPFGCRVGAKQSVVKTWLSDAHARRRRGSWCARGWRACSSPAAPRAAWSGGPRMATR